jgi:hypothetical protein
MEQNLRGMSNNKSKRKKHDIACKVISNEKCLIFSSDPSLIFSLFKIIIRSVGCDDPTDLMVILKNEKIMRE